jgi:hypothetical protein
MKRVEHLRNHFGVGYVRICAGIAFLQMRCPYGYDLTKYCNNPLTKDYAKLRIAPQADRKVI